MEKLNIRIMGTTTWTRAAKCKDCKFIKPFYKGKLKRHKCSNPDSLRFLSTVSLNELVCDKWEL